MSAIEGHSLGVSNTLLDGDREGMNSQPHSHSQCLHKYVYRLCLYVLNPEKGILIEEEKEKPETPPLLPGISDLCIEQNRRCFVLG